MNSTWMLMESQIFGVEGDCCWLALFKQRNSWEESTQSFVSTRSVKLEMQLTSAI